MPPKKRKNLLLIIVLALIACGVILYLYWPNFSNTIKYDINQSVANEEEVKDGKTLGATVKVTDVAPIVAPVTHVATPKIVKAIYSSAWVAGSPKYRDPLIKIIDETEINSIVIDVKDSTGRISFMTSNDELNKMGSVENRIRDVRALTNLLHQKNIYVIGRVAVFQDPYMTKAKPAWAITKKSDGTVWKDRKGLSFLDPANKEVWKYAVDIARAAYADGFDEINFDYIRYPSDGNIKDINYHLVNGATRSDNIESFFKYLSEEVKKGSDVKTSADLFGLTTEVNDDMGIGQVWEKALPHFDYLAPMIYPSHYPAGSGGFKNPADHPYEIISNALSRGIQKTKAVVPAQDIQKIRPWLQDFDLGATYTKEMVRAQIKAVNDAGIDSWMLWNPSNRYTPSALELEIKS